MSKFLLGQKKQFWWQNSFMIEHFLNGVCQVINTKMWETCYEKWILKWKTIFLTQPRNDLYNFFLMINFCRTSNTSEKFGQILCSNGISLDYKKVKRHKRLLYRLSNNPLVKISVFTSNLFTSMVVCSPYCPEDSFTKTSLHCHSIHLYNDHSTLRYLSPNV